MTKYIFVLGTGRIASYYLRYLFSYNVPNTYAVHEPKRYIKILSNRYVSGKANSSDLKKYLRKFKIVVDRQLAKNNSNIYFHSDPWLFGFADFIPKIFENAYILHIVRNPMSFIPSFLNMFYDNYFKGLLRDIIPYWKLKGCMTGDYSSEVWRNMSKVEQTAWYWFFVNNYLSERSNSFPKYLLLKYENIFADNLLGLKKIFDFCELDLDVNNINFERITSKKNIVAEKFSAICVEKHETQIYDICSNLIEKYDY